jgi:hypothetical protein
MAAATSPAVVRQIQQQIGFAEAPEAERCTLLELVKAVGEITRDDHEVVATVIHMLRSGSVRLNGNFHDEPISHFDDDSDH